MMASNDRKQRWALFVAVVGLATWLIVQRSDAWATPPSATSPSPTTPSTDSAIARIAFTTSPPVHATVSWGNTRLGRITPQQPLIIERPRDSGPLDVIVRAQGFLLVHTRAHTFADTRLQVKLTRPSEKSTLLGYRAPIDAGMELGLDDGIPAPLSDAIQPEAVEIPGAAPAPPAAGP